MLENVLMMMIMMTTINTHAGFVVGVKRALIGPERTADPTVPVTVTYAPMLELCHEPQTVVSPLVRASLALHNEGALLPFLAGDLSPVDIMYRLSGVSQEFYIRGCVCGCGCGWEAGGSIHRGSFILLTATKGVACEHIFKTWYSFFFVEYTMLVLRAGLVVMYVHRTFFGTTCAEGVLSDVVQMAISLCNCHRSLCGFLLPF